jgi:hypothetical protein
MRTFIVSAIVIAVVCGAPHSRAYAQGPINYFGLPSIDCKAMTSSGLVSIRLYSGVMYSNGVCQYGLNPAPYRLRMASVHGGWVDGGCRAVQGQPLGFYEDGQLSACITNGSVELKGGSCPAYHFIELNRDGSLEKCGSSGPDLAP